MQNMQYSFRLNSQPKKIQMSMYICLSQEYSWFDYVDWTDQVTKNCVLQM